MTDPMTIADHPSAIKPLRPPLWQYYHENIDDLTGLAEVRSEMLDLAVGFMEKSSNL